MRPAAPALQDDKKRGLVTSVACFAFKTPLDKIGIISYTVVMKKNCEKESIGKRSAPP